MSLLALYMSSGDHFTISRKGGTGGGGRDYHQDEKSMAMLICVAFQPSVLTRKRMFANQISNSTTGKKRFCHDVICQHSLK